MTATTATTATTTTLLREVAIKAELVKSRIDYLAQHTADAADTIQAGRKIYHASNVTRAAEEYAQAVAELNQTNVIAAMFATEEQLAVANMGMGPLHEMLNG